MAEKRKRSTKQEMQEKYRNTSEYLSDGLYNGIYNGKEIMGFKKGQQYVFKLTKPINECYTLGRCSKPTELIPRCSISQFFNVPM